MKRINAENIAELLKNKPNVKSPNYKREDIKAGIVHLGIGAFHRAHQAFYTEAVLNSQGGDWGIIGCSLRSAGVKLQLQEQDGLYTLVERGPEGEKFQVIGAIKSVLVGPENPRALLEQMSEENIKIVSLTVTEKGYCHDPASGDLNLNHPDIAHDLNNIAQPRSAVAYIVAALDLRRKKNIQAFTALSCDNLPNNGDVLKKVVTQFAQKLDVALATWIQENVSFPNTMIDRIVPATTADDKKHFEDVMGFRDEGIVIAEPFSQWVIENTFCNDRPRWEDAGALLVNDVDIFEKMKLRLLNGSHSLLAYCGYLSGKNTVSEVMQEPVFVELATLFMDREAGETLETPAGFEVAHYKKQLRERFANPGLRHRTWQIAMDGSQKLPQRLLNTLRDQLKTRGNIDILCLAVAAWIRYVSGVDEAGEPIDVQDPFAAKLRACHDKNSGNIAAIVKDILNIREIFGDDLASSNTFVHGVTDWLTRFYKDGVLNSIKTHLNFV